MATNRGGDAMASFTQAVGNWLRSIYGTDVVDPSPRLPDTEWMPAYRVTAPVCTFMVVTAADMDAIVAGVGLAELCAAHDRHAVPIVVCPPGLMDRPTIDIISNRAQATLVPLPEQYHAETEANGQ